MEILVVLLVRPAASHRMTGETGAWQYRAP
jgi:hypothetical protein